MNAGNSDLQNLRSYSYVLVARCHPDEPTWRRAQAIMSAFALDPRQFKDPLTQPGMQLLERPLVRKPGDHWAAARVPTDFYVANPAFCVSVNTLISFPVDDQEQREEFCRAIAEAVQTQRFRASQRRWKLDELRKLEEQAKDHEEIALHSSFSQEHRQRAKDCRERIAALERELADPGDLPVSAVDCGHLADSYLSATYVGMEGPLRFERAVQQLVMRAEEEIFVTRAGERHRDRDRMRAA